MRVFLLAQEKVLALHPLNLASSLSIRNLKSFVLDFEENTGGTKIEGINWQAFHLEFPFYPSLCVILNQFRENEPRFLSVNLLPRPKVICFNAIIESLYFPSISFSKKH